MRGPGPARPGPWVLVATTVLTYEDLSMEHSAIRNSATVYDLCPMIKYRIEGPDATAFLDRLTIRNVAKLSWWCAIYRLGQ